MHAVDIPCEVLQDGQRFLLVVPSAFGEQARYEIWSWESENREKRPRSEPIKPVYQDSAWGVAGYVALISIVAVLAGEAAFNRNWLEAGRVDGAMIRAGEWWRAITALTLHSGLPHFVGNVVFGAVFGVMAGRVLGPGVTWLAVLIAATFGNLLNTFLLDADHRAIAAVFAALGLISGFAWRGKLFAQDRWAWRLGPIVGGIALLAYTGTGGENTDIGAHLAGFVCGFAGGVLLTRVYHLIPDARVQKLCGAAAVMGVCGAWLIAL